MTPHPSLRRFVTLLAVVVFGVAFSVGTASAREDFFRPATGNILPNVVGVERATVSDQGGLLLTTETGEAVSGFPVLVQDSTFVTAPIMADFGGNNTLYLVAVTRDSNDVYTLRAFDSAGAELASEAIGTTVYYDPVVWKVPGGSGQDVVLVGEDGTVMDFHFSNGAFTKTNLVSLGAPAAVTFSPTGDEFTAVFPGSKSTDIYTRNGNAWQLSKHVVLNSSFVYPVAYNNQNDTLYGVDALNRLTAINKQTGNVVNGFPVALSGFALCGPTLTNAKPLVAGMEITVPTQNKVLIYGADGSVLGSTPSAQSFAATAGSIAIKESVFASLNAFSAALTVPLGAAQVVSPYGTLRIVPLGNQNAPQISVVTNLMYHPTSTLTNGQTFNYGDVDVSTTAFALIKIINTGSADLNLSGAPTLGGVNAAEFFVSTTPDLLIPANSSSTFEVDILPASQGAKQATLTINSDDPNENPFIIHLAANVKDVQSIVYEDAEDGSVARWLMGDDTHGQVPMTITNVADDMAHGKAIEIAVGDYNKQDYVLLNADGVNKWSNDIPTMRRLKFDLKTVNDVNIYVRIKTKDGSTYFLSYNFDNPNNGLVGNRYAYIKLDPALKDGTWHTITRDLAADFAALVPGQTIAYVHWFEIGSKSARVDNVLLTKEPLVAYQIAGALTDENNAPISGALVTLTPYGQTAVTNASGTYAFPGVDNGTYIVVPTSALYDFAPTSTQVVVMGANATANFTGTHGAYSLYEDAEDGVTNRWKLSGGTGVNTITNVVDDGAHNHVIEIANSDYFNNNYVLNNKDGITSWHNNKDTVIKFDLKSSNEVYAFVALQTDQNQLYYLWYSFGKAPGAVFGRYASVNLNPAFKDGQWHTVTRDLSADLHSVFPNVNIASVENLIVGSLGARVDNVKLVNRAFVHSIGGTVVGQNNQPLVGEIVSLNEEGIATTTDNNGAYQFNTLIPGTYTVAPVDQMRVFTPASRLVTITNADGVANFAELAAGTKIYEDAEDGSVGRWVPTGAGGVNSITNIVDEDAAHNKVIEIKDSDYYNYNYTLKDQDGVSLWNNATARTFAFDLKTEDNIRTFVRLTTDQGTRYLMYSFSPVEGPFAGRYYGFSLSPTFKDGTWHTIVRDLAADAAVAFPGVTISAVEEFVAGGVSMRIDNVKLSAQNLVFSVTGTITDDNNQPFSGAQVTLAPSGQTVTTDQNGAYTFSTLVAGQYTVTPSKPLYTFTPSSTNIIIINSNQTANFVAAPQTTFVYEDAEDGTTNKWKQLGNTGINSITNVADDQAHNRVIEIASEDPINNNYQLGDKNPNTPWNNTVADTIQFDVKTANDFSVFVEVVANGQTRYVMYSTYRPTGVVFGRYASIRIDPAIKDGQWHAISRNLTTDLNSLFPGEQITAVNTFLFGAYNARVDNVTLVSPALVHAVNGTIKDGNSQPVAGVTITLAPNGIKTVTDANGNYSFAALVAGTYTVSPTSSNYTFAPPQSSVVITNADVVVDFTATAIVQAPADVVYEDAEDGSVARWKLSGAGGVDSLENIVDEDVAHNKVIEIKDQDMQNYNYTLYAADGVSVWNNTTNRTFSYDIKTQNEARIFVQLSTDQGTKYLLYSFDFPVGAFLGRYYSINLDANLKDGAWHTILRDLNADAATAFPGATITAVEGLVAGSPTVRLDNIKLKP